MRIETTMRTRSLWGVTLASLGILVTAAGSGWAAERSLVGITLGRTYKSVLDKYGTPDLMVPVTLPTASALLASTGFGLGVGQPGATDPGGSPYGTPGGLGSPGGYPGSAPGGPGYGAPGGYPGSGPGGPGGPPGGYPGSAPGGPGYGAPGGYPSGPGGPPVLPPGGGEMPGAPGYGGPMGAGGGYGGDPSAAGGGQQGNAVKWVYARPNGGSLEFWINEDGRVAQIAATGRTGTATTSKGVRLGSTYSQVLKLYGAPETHRTSSVPPEVAAVMGLNRDANKQKRRDQLSSYAQLYGGSVSFVNLVNDVLYTSKHHAAFTFLGDKCVRITIALAD
jgi:hypothetical protein